MGKIKLSNWNEYQEMCKMTVTFDKEVALPYIGLKMNGEVAELTEKVVGDEHLDLLLKEVGDVLWYCSTLMSMIGISYSDLKLDEFVMGLEGAGSCNIHCQVTRLLRAHISAGRIAEQIGKSIRDDDGVLSEHRMHEIKSDLIMLVGTMFLFSYHKRRSPHANPMRAVLDVMEMNVGKILDRRDRGAIKGDGDER